MGHTPRSFSGASGQLCSSESCLLPHSRLTTSGGMRGAIFLTPNPRSLQRSQCLFCNNLSGEDYNTFCGSKLTGLIKSCLFEQNRAHVGGGIYGMQTTSKLVVQNCSFQRNFATNFGGASFFYNTTVTIINCAFVENFSPNGGAVHFVGHGNHLNVIQCKVQETNIHTQNAECDSAVKVDAAQFFTENSIFYANVGSAILFMLTTAVIVNCSFCENKGGFGGAITTDDLKSLLELKNTSFYGNSGVHASNLFSYNEITLIQNCNFQSNDVPRTLNIIVIKSRTKITLRICGCVFWKAQVHSKSVVLLLPMADEGILHATLYFWETFISTKEMQLTIQNTSIEHVATEGMVNFTQVFSQFASGTAFGFVDF